MLVYEKPTANKSLIKVIDGEEAFCFHTYSYIPRGITKLLDDESEEINLLSEICPPKAQICPTVSKESLILAELRRGPGLVLRRI